MGTKFLASWWEVQGIPKPAAGIWSEGSLVDEDALIWKLDPARGSWCQNDVALWNWSYAIPREIHKAVCSCGHYVCSCICSHTYKRHPVMCVGWMNELLCNSGFSAHCLSLGCGSCLTWPTQISPIRTYTLQSVLCVLELTSVLGRICLSVSLHLDTQMPPTWTLICLLSPTIWARGKI